jgi:methylisocitrate lyase
MAGKEVIPQEEYSEKLGAAIDARQSKDFIIVARTDSLATEGLDSAIERSLQNKKIGADAIFIEAPKSFEEMKQIGKAIRAPLVANMIEGGTTPNLSSDKLFEIGFKIILYPLSILFANSFATMKVLKELKKNGTTKGVKHQLVNFDEFNSLVGLNNFQRLEKKYRVYSK